MERVLSTPELLHMIFGLLDPSSNAANARVCEQWSDLALEMIWRNVEDPYLLFKILAPLKTIVESSEWGPTTYDVGSHSAYIRILLMPFRDLKGCQLQKTGNDS